MLSYKIEVYSNGSAWSCWIRYQKCIGWEDMIPECCWLGWALLSEFTDRNRRSLNKTKAQWNTPWYSLVCLIHSSKGKFLESSRYTPNQRRPEYTRLRRSPSGRSGIPWTCEYTGRLFSSCECLAWWVTFSQWSSNSWARMAYLYSCSSVSLDPESLGDGTYATDHVSLRPSNYKNQQKKLGKRHKDLVCNGNHGT